MATSHRPATILAVASAGGHLEQLTALLKRVTGPTDRIVWVTYQVPQAEGLLGTGYRIFAHHPTTKSIPNAVRNYWLARQVFAKHEIGRVISSGAAVAVPFIIRARQLGIPCHYIESATRVKGPSLSGRMIDKIPGVHRYRQMGGWGLDRWRQGPRVFDGFEVEHSPMPSSGQKMIVVSLGTHHFGFPQLLERLQDVLPDKADIVWQIGSSPPPPDIRGRVERQLPAGELARLIGEADVVVGHAGVGLALTALAAGKVPVLVPRRRSRREHTDDHQVELARELDRMGLAVTAEVGELSFEHLERAAALRVTYREPPPFELVD
jgi:UDP-N-acetylglucosamine--N-acetylmuramyl-(pentapeptide) pyrophosphoryl-undecaprenol N-acetylglucosamine transferase